jgi:hypothetical protein
MISAYAFLAMAVLQTGCAVEEESGDSAEQESTANGITCEVRLDALTTENLHGIAIDERSSSKKISFAEKARHLNELNKLPSTSLDVFRTLQIPIYLTGGSIVNFPQFRSLRGQRPRNWESGTWDSVPGTGNATGVYLGNSATGNGAASLAIHEATHAIDLSLKLSENSTKLKRLYKRELERPALDNELERYRRGHIEEFLAVAVDQYYCNATTRNLLKGLHPEIANYVEKDLQQEIRSATEAR